MTRPTQRLGVEAFFLVGDVDVDVVDEEPCATTGTWSKLCVCMISAATAHVEFWSTVTAIGNSKSRMVRWPKSKMGLVGLEGDAGALTGASAALTGGLLSSFRKPFFFIQSSLFIVSTPCTPSSAANILQELGHVVAYRVREQYHAALARLQLLRGNHGSPHGGSGRATYMPSVR